MTTKKKKKEENWHAYFLNEVYKKIDSKEDGLSEVEAEERLKKFGKNQIGKDRKQSIAQLFIREINNPLIYLLLVAALFSILIGHYIDASAIIFIIGLNTILGVLQTWRAEKAISALKDLTASQTKVIRNSKLKQINAENVVPGDIVVFESGDLIPTDLRLIETNELQVDESSITGESEPVKKSLATLEKEIPLAERKNMAYMSSPVTRGKGKGVAVATGKNTETGKIASKVRRTEREMTPIQKKLDQLGKLIGSAAIGFAIFIFALGYLKNYDAMEMLLYAIASAVSAIPEGLPGVVSITLALGVRRMAKKKAVIRRLPAVETLGSTTVICSDKTGTITKNEMEVAKIYSCKQTYDVESEKINTKEKPLEILFSIGRFANDAEEDEQGNVRGNSTDCAIFRFSKHNQIQDQDSWKRIDEIPFSSERGYMAALCEKDNKKILFVKGAPEKIINFSNKILYGSEADSLDDDSKRELSKISQNLANEALRVIAGGYKELQKDDIDQADVENELIFADYWGIMDPPREESFKAIKDCKQAGIKVILNTGDNPVTAKAIATKVGISESEAHVITGRDLDDKSDNELANLISDIKIFGRVTPLQKLKILKILKNNGEIVAMTGNGVNDAPALKAAHIGVAMGIAGTQVAKEAADIVLQDDNFATIVSAIQEGRLIFNNLRNVVFFLVTTNLGEILFLSAALIFNFPLPLTPIMILWINMVTDGPCDVALGMESKHGELLKAKPRPKGEGIITKEVILRSGILSLIMAVGTFSLFWHYLVSQDLQYAKTVAFTTLTIFQWCNAINARSDRLSIFSYSFFSNKWLIVAILITFILHLGAVYLPLGQAVFNTVPLSTIDWLTIFTVSLSVIAADEIRKWVLKTTKKSND